MNVTFRTEIYPGDPERVREIVVSTGFFYDFEVPVAVELAEERLQSGEESGYFFLFAESEGKTLAYACYGPVAGSEGSFDLYWIATDNAYRGGGIGKRLLSEVHRAIRRMGGRLVVAETSTLEKYEPTRRFYLQCGYRDEARIEDFYKPGDGKVFFVKRLTEPE